MPETPASPRFSGGCLTWPSLALLAATAIICFTALKSCDRLAVLVQAWTSAFGRSEITTSFHESIRQVKATHGDVLELATLEAEETFTRIDAKSTAWDLIYLGTTVSEIRAAAVYRYHLMLSDDWQVSRQNQTCLVIAPLIRPSQPPALRTDRMEKKTQAGWARFNAADNLAQLEKSLTPMLERRAGNPAHLEQVREPARKAVAEFVKTWALKETTGEPRITKIIVVFADEPAAKTPQASLQHPPTLELVP